jgi:hypothetical protein
LSEFSGRLDPPLHLLQQGGLQLYRRLKSGRQTGGKREKRLVGGGVVPAGVSQGRKESAFAFRSGGVGWCFRLEFAGRRRRRDLQRGASGTAYDFFPGATFGGQCIRKR